MSPELEAKFCEKYPTIFRDRHAPMTQTAMCWGFNCGDGWYKLIDDLCAKLVEVCPGVVASQVKEKVGGLRFYVWGANSAAWAAIAATENESERTCEVCGEPGNINYEASWLECRCEAHK